MDVVTTSKLVISSIKETPVLAMHYCDNGTEFLPGTLLPKQTLPWDTSTQTNPSLLLSVTHGQWLECR